MSDRHPALLTTDELSAWCGYTRRSDIEQWLRDRGIPWWPGKGGQICTTLEAVNGSLRPASRGNVEAVKF